MNRIVATLAAFVAAWSLGWTSALRAQDTKPADPSGHPRSVAFAFGGLLPFSGESASSFLGFSFGLGDGHGGELAASAFLHEDQSETAYSFTVPRLSFEWTPRASPSTHLSPLVGVRHFRGDTSVLTALVLRTDRGESLGGDTTLGAWFELRLAVREIVAGEAAWRTRAEAEFRLVGRKVWGGGRGSG